MKKIKLWLIGLLSLTYAVMLWARPEQEVQGIFQLNNTDGNVNAIAYHDGILFFATQIGVEMYLYNQSIGNFPYAELTGQAQIDRDSDIRLLPDADSLLVWDKSNSDLVGTLKYKKGKTGQGNPCRAQQIWDGNKQQQAEDLFKQTLQHMGWQVTAVAKNELISSEHHPVWLVGTKHNGLFQCTYDSQYKKLDSTRLNFKSASGTPVRHILSLKYLPDCGSVAIGTCGDGAFLWSQRRDQVFKPVFDPPPNSDGQERHFWSFAKLGDTAFLAGNDVGEVIQYNNQGKRWHKPLPLEENNPAIRDWQVRCLVPIPGKKQQFLAGTNQGGIFLLDYSRRIPSSRKVSARFGKILCMQIDTAGKGVWIGTDQGVWKYNVANGEFLPETKSTQQADFFYLHQDMLFFGGKRGKLYYLVADSIHAITTDFRQDDICNMLFLASGKVLLFTRNNFVRKGHLENDRFVHEYTFKDVNGFAFRDRQNANQVYPMSTIYGGYEMDSVVWCGTNFGIIRFNPQDTNSVANFYYKTATGLPAIEFNTNAFLQLNDSVLVFGSRRGLLLMNIKKANQFYKERDRPAIQLWKVKSDDGLDRYPMRYLQQIFERVEPGSSLSVAYDDKNQQFLPIVPDYSLLETPHVYVQNGSQKTPIIAAGRPFPPAFLLGEFNEWGRSIALQLSHVKGPSASAVVSVFSFNQGLSGRLEGQMKVAWLIAIAVLIGLLLWWISWRKKEQRLQKAKAIREEQQKMREERLLQEQQRLLQEQKRRQFFIDLGKASAEARSYEDLHHALQRIVVNAEQVLGSSKIAVSIYEAGANRLRTIAHAETAPTIPLSFDVVNKVVYNLGEEVAQRRPLVYQWLKGKAGIGDTLVENNSATDFYAGQGRPKPKLGRPCESFDFKTLAVNEMPFAILSIQNEERNAYSGQEHQEVLDNLNIVGFFVSLSLDIIERTKAAQVDRATLKNFNDIVEKRLSQHIATNFVERIGRMYPGSKPTTDAFKTFLSEVYTADPISYGNYELNIIRHYTPLCEFLYGKKSINIKVVNESLIQRYRLPAFVLLNAVNNSMKHSPNPEVNIEIKGEKKDLEINGEKAGFLVLSVLDDGPGIDFDKLQARKNQRSSTWMIEQYFADLEQKTGYKIPSPEMENVGPNNTKAQVTFYLPFVLLELFKKI